MQELEVGYVLEGKYELLRLLEAGGGGAVYEAREADARCLVRVFGGEAEEGDARVAQAERWAAAARSDASAHVGRVLDAGVDVLSSRLFMAMEMLEGESLDALRERLGAVPPQLVIRIGLQACEGLAWIHRHGAHGAISAASVLVCSDGDERVVKVRDVGVARLEEESAGEPRDDVRSLGLVLRELLDGSEETALAEVIAKALHEGIDERYQSAEELSEALRGVLDGEARITADMLARQTGAQKEEPVEGIGDLKTAPMPIVEPVEKPVEEPVEKPIETRAEKRASGRPPAKTVPLAAVEPAPPPIPVAAARAGGRFIPLDATIALAGDEPADPVEMELPPTAAPAPVDNLNATLALPEMPLFGVALPPVAEPAKPGDKWKPVKASPEPAPVAPARATPAAVAPPQPPALADAVARHLASRRAAMDAARLPSGDAPKGGRGLIVAGGIVGVIAIAIALYFALRGGETAPEATGETEAATADTTAGATSDTSAEADTPADTSASPEPSATPSAAPSGSAAVEGGVYRVTITPAYAAVRVDRVPVRLKDGVLEITGKPGDKHIVIVTVPGRAPMLVQLEITADGPVPASIQGPPARVSGRR